MTENEQKLFVMMSTRFDFDSFRERQKADLGPGHATLELAEFIGAEIIQPEDNPPSFLDHLLSRLIGSAEHWANARKVLSSADKDTVIYATGEDIGLPLAICSGLRRSDAHIGIHFSAPRRPRAKWIAKIASRICKNLFVLTGTPDKAEFLGDWIGKHSKQVTISIEQTDTRFFSPGTEVTRLRERPLIASCGLEQRDYITLAKAAGELDVDIRVCAVSPNFTDQTSVNIPKVVPSNMELRHYEFDELRALYRQACISIVPLLPNNFSAGLTTMLEAMATGSPVIVTDTPGLTHQMVERDFAVGVPPQNANALRNAIQQVLDNPNEAAKRAKRAREWVLKEHTTTAHIEHLSKIITNASIL